jgi:putative membrane protein
MQRAAALAIPLIACLLAWRRLDVRVAGANNVPSSGPVLIAARHYHHLFDGLALILATHRQLHFVVTLDWVRGPIIRPLMRWATRMARWPAFPRSDALERARIEENHGGLSATEFHRCRRAGFVDAVQLLVEGMALLVFPEGYPNIDPHFTPKTAPNEFLPFRTGFATILARAEGHLEKPIPVIPAGIHYTPGPSHWIAHVRFGVPVLRKESGSRTAFVRHVQQRVEVLSAQVSAQNAPT